MSLRDKASKINFGGLVPPVPSLTESRLAKTAPGAMMGEANDRRSELLRENEALRTRVAHADGLEARYTEVVEDLRAWEGAKPMRMIDPHLVHRGPLANRSPINFTGPEFDAFKQEIVEAGGNVVPVKVRTSGGVDGLSYELIYGHRRHQVALETGMPLLAIIDNLDDKAAFEEMERENRGHTKPSPWEQGLSYDRAITVGLYPSARQCAVALGVDPSNLAKALTLAHLPLEVLRAFHSPLAIQLRWGTALKAALDADSVKVIKRASELQTLSPKLSPRKVLEELVAASSTSEPDRAVSMVPEPHRAYVRSFTLGGKQVARMKQTLKRTELIVMGPLTPARQQRLEELVAKFLDATVS